MQNFAGGSNPNLYKFSPHVQLSSLTAFVKEILCDCWYWVVLHLLSHHKQPHQSPLGSGLRLPGYLVCTTVWMTAFTPAQTNRANQANTPEFVWTVTNRLGVKTTCLCLCCFYCSFTGTFVLFSKHFCFWLCLINSICNWWKHKNVQQVCMNLSSSIGCVSSLQTFWSEHCLKAVSQGLCFVPAVIVYSQVKIYLQTYHPALWFPWFSKLMP